MDPAPRLAQMLYQNHMQNRSHQRPPPETAPAPPPPPPYSEGEDDDSDGDIHTDNDDDEALSPVRLVINAAHSVQGSNNLVPTSASPLADASKFGTLLLHAVNQINGLPHCCSESSRRRRRRRRRTVVRVDLTINCGLVVVGDRNVIGPVGLRPRTGGGGAQQVAAAGPGPAVVAGAKRKAMEDLDESTEGAGEQQQAPTKRVAVAGRDDA